MRKLAILAVLLTSLVLTGCAGEQSVPDYAPAEENRLTIYTSHKEEVYGHPFYVAVG